MAYGDSPYGLLQYGQDPPTEEQVIPLVPNLMKYLPTYYSGDGLMAKLQDAIAKEVGLYNYYKQDLLNQWFVDTATWGLTIWEQELGIQTDISKSYEARRELIKAKLRGMGTATKALFQNVAESFSGGEVDIIENPADYSFIVKFIGVKGIPKNMAGLIQTIEDIKPAHLSYSFQYTFTWWNKLQELTWAQAGLRTWDEIKAY